ACLASHNLNFPNRPVRTRTPGGVAGWCGRGPASLLAAPMPIVRTFRVLTQYVDAKKPGARPGFSD
ncbi:hypothetical protein, partial [Candidatus Burkholderia verschuerenii]|uniref:hypothetical protein n=1 Tax=Candidatus Burkholderia verschuerenii TaxID=242163 RepID=UPI000ACBE7B0